MSDRYFFMRCSVHRRLTWRSISRRCDRIRIIATPRQWIGRCATAPTPAGCCCWFSNLSLPADILYRCAPRPRDDPDRDRLQSPRETYVISIFGDIRFTSPVTKETKRDRRLRSWGNLVGQTKTISFVLALYMQILSDGCLRSFSGRLHHIHHSFSCRGFKRAALSIKRNQARRQTDRATAHTFTSAPPPPPPPPPPRLGRRSSIRTSSAISLATPDDLVRKGRDSTAGVLQRAMRHHIWKTA